MGYNFTSNQNKNTGKFAILPNKKTENLLYNFTMYSYLNIVKWITFSNIVVSLWAISTPLRLTIWFSFAIRIKNSEFLWSHYLHVVFFFLYIRTFTIVVYLINYLFSFSVLVCLTRERKRKSKICIPFK